MNRNLILIKSHIYDNCELVISNYKNELEGKKYNACQFDLNGMKILCRSAKITPKKVGQFVTLWKRDEYGLTTPYSEIDKIDFYVINTWSPTNFGQFVFPKSELIQKGIVSSKKMNGKRGFRVYPIWDVARNKQAEKSQKWQLKYFYDISKTTDLTRVTELYQM